MNHLRTEGSTIDGGRLAARRHLWDELERAPRHRRAEPEEDGAVDGARRRARGLGVFSLALGASQILAPGGLSSLIGIRPGARTRGTMLAVGLREIASGIGLLARRRPVGFAWMRVAGDVMDIALLANALRARGARRGRLTAALASVAGVTAVDVATALALARRRSITLQKTADGAVRVQRSITVRSAREDVYAFWRNFENLPRFMAHLESVRVLDGRQSQWRARGPAGRSFDWTALIIEEQPSELIAWRSVEPSEITTSGVVRFLPAPGDRGTEVHVDLRYQAPGGLLGASLAKLLGREPGQEIEGDLRRFKQVMETGEVVHSDASIHKGKHPARPPAQAPASLNGRKGGAR